MAQIKGLDELQEIAPLATYDALKEFQPLPAEWQANLTLGVGIDGDYRVFELYVAVERPEDAIVISSARVHSKTKLVEVTISNLIKIG
jgi:hypothetical protein